VLKEMGAVEKTQAVLVSGEMGGHPVHDHPDAVFVQAVYEVHKILGSAVSGTGSEIGYALITPGSVKGMLAHGHEFHMGEPVFFKIKR
jgi:hypothetical protein